MISKRFDVQFLLCISLLIFKERIFSMANQKVRNRQIDSDIFKQYLKEHSLSVKDISSKTGIAEKTLKRCLDDKCMSIGIVLDICKILDENAIALFGEDDSSQWRTMLSYLTSEERRH